jgi:type II secretion system protein N
VNRFWQHPKAVAAAWISLYSLFFMAILIVALPLTFPTRHLRGLLARAAAQQGYPLVIQDLRLGLLGGVDVLGIAMTLPGKVGEPGEGGQPGPSTPEVTLQIDRISARVALLSLLSGKVDVRFDIEAGGGKVEGGRFVRMGDAFDLDIEQIAEMSLADMGIGPRLLPAQHMSGALEGELSGKVQVHFGGTTEDLTGAVELDLADALLRAPRLTMQGGLDLADLALGTVHLKVKMNLKQQLAALAQERGGDKDTIIHIEQLEATGEQVDILTEETSHVRIPPGKLGWKQAQIQLHFAFALRDPAKAKPADKGDSEETAKADGGGKDGKDAAAAKSAEANKDRLQWASVLTMAGSKLKPFERGGFIGVSCTGPVARPQCKLDIPRVSTGTRAAGALRPEGGAPPTPAGGTDGADKGSDRAGAVEAPPPPVEFRPVPRLEAPVPQTPPPEIPQAPPPPIPEPQPEPTGRPPAVEQGGDDAARRPQQQDPPAEPPPEQQEGEGRPQRAPADPEQGQPEGEAPEGQEPAPQEAEPEE